MLSRRVILIASVISVIIGLTLLVTSSVVLDLVGTELKNCDSLRENEYAQEDAEEVEEDALTNNVTSCEHGKYVITAASLGIIVGLIQMTSFGLAWLEKTKIWCSLHILISILSLVSYGFGVSKSESTNPEATEIVGLTVVYRIDMIFALIVAVAVYFFKQ